jgi:type IV secretory pathway protease TraF
MPESTNDFSTYHLANVLKDIADSLPLGLYFVTDAAFPLSEHILIPFFGSQRFASAANDSFNYYLSQM